MKTEMAPTRISMQAATHSLVPLQVLLNSLAEMVVLLRTCVEKRLIPVGQSIVVFNRFLELAVREVDSVAINSIVEVPDLSVSRFENLAAKHVLNHQCGHVALARSWFVFCPQSA